MLRLYPSNKTEHLAVVISEIMKASPLPSTFSNEVILIQSHGMGTWLQQEISQNLGIAAMIECSMPASFIWQLSQILMPEETHIPIFEKNNVRWQILERLPEKLSDPRYSSLKNYIAALSTSLKAESCTLTSPEPANYSEHVLFELSDVLADLFDAYQNYRPDWIDAWEKGERANHELSLEASFSNLEAWQADLWRCLYPESNIEKRNHRAILLSKLLARLQHCPDELKARLPERVFVFGLSALPPKWLPVLTALSQYTDVHFMIQNPCQYYWGDVISEAQQLKLEQSLLASGVSADTAADTFIESNPLLASWGRLGRDYLSILYGDDGIKEMPVNLYEDVLLENPDDDASSISALAYLQSDILNLQAIQRQVDDSDKSIRFVSCHSHLREVEALHDYLFQLLDETPELNPKDVIVMMPDVQDFAALIDAIFSRPAFDQYGQPQYLPYGISDQMLALDQPMVDVLSGILNLSTLRITATEVLDWLDLEAIRERFKISEDDLVQVHAWISGLNIRWGLSEKHRDQCLSSIESVQGSGMANTWMSGFKRLLAGYVYGVNSHIHDAAGEVFSQSQYSREMQVLAGKLMRFIDLIEQTLDLQKGKKGVQTWLKIVTGFWNTWFDAEYLSEEVQRLMDLSVTSIGEQVSCAGFEQTLSFAIIAEVIAAGFEKERVNQRFLAGRINFCTLMPMRSIPFKVVCMLGMNEGQYPRPEQKVSFDLLALGKARIGDRSRREDDRYLFLEALCSARNNMYISYCGRDIKDNSERYPSLLVSELQDYCGRYFYLHERDESSAEQLINHWMIQHRLQPFHPWYFFDSARVNDLKDLTYQSLPVSYSADWISLHNSKKTVQKTDSSTGPSARLSVPDIPPAIPQFDMFQESVNEGREFELTSLTSMAVHPLRYYYRHILGLSYTYIASELEDSEPFSLSHLDAYYLKSDLAQSWNQLSLTDTSEIYAQWKLSDSLPRSPVDKFYYDEAETSLASMQAYVVNHAQSTKHILDLRFANKESEDRVVGELLIQNVDGKGLIELSLSKNIAGRFFGFWVKHIFWNVHCGRTIKTAPDIKGLSGISTLVTINKVWTFPALDLALAEQYANEVLALFSSLETHAYPFLAKSTFALLFEKETQVKSAFKGVNIGDSVIQGERDDPYWQRYCLFSKEEGGSLNAEQMPLLTQSIFYQQLIGLVDQIEVNELELPEQIGLALDLPENQGGGL
jgi:exodeoxyribonuclease V gamma subunit